MIELPKDAEGREIPLDTKRLYDADGFPAYWTPRVREHHEAP